MFYTGMAGTRNVPLQTSLEGMKEYQKEDSKESSSRESAQQNEQELEKSYGIPGDMQYLVDAETVSNVQDVKESLKDKKLEVTNSDMPEMDKRISLQKLQNIEERCNRKIDRLRFEISLEKMIAQAEQAGDTEKAAELRQEYSREKNLRKSKEYTDLQRMLLKENQTMEQKAYMLYDSSQTGSDLRQKMNTAGNYVDLVSAEL